MEKELIAMGRMLVEKKVIDNNLIQQTINADIYLPFAHLRKTLGLTQYEEILVCLLWYYQKENGKGLQYRDMVSLLEPYENKNEKDILPPCFHFDGQEVYLSPVAFQFLEGRFPNEKNGMEFLLPKKNIVYDEEKLLKPARILIKGVRENQLSDPMALVLSGETGSGREYLAEQIAAEQGTSLLKISEIQLDYTSRDINEIVMGAGLYGSMVCIDIRTKIYTKLIKELSFYLPIIIIIKNEDQEIKEDIGYTLVTQKLTKPELETKMTILKEYLEKEEIPEGIKLETIASNRLPMGEFIRFGKSIQAEIKIKIFELEKTIYQSGSNYLKLLPSTRDFKDLILPNEQGQQLKKICDMIASKEQVMKKWGFEKKFSYGNGMSLLFHGAPGTGKTMAAEVMANKLEMPLYRVDLSQLTSKYIGETQKNIGKIFKEAGKSECILLFDEADAIFARRSEVSDAQDRYSNGETAYLLQEMEQYSGVSILATNLLQNFDEAFRRRITYMVHFPLPDVKLREKIWETIIPEEAHVSKDIDYKALAQLFELSGAAIKNAVMQGACLAMAKNHEISMSHLLNGIHNEYIKNGKSLNEAQKELIVAYEVAI